MDNIYDFLRRYEFNKTEAETLEQLVREASGKGGLAREKIRQMSRSAKKISDRLEGEELISVLNASDIPDIGEECLVGIDGSSQLVGGYGGTWYAPISCATVVFPKGVSSQPEVTVEARIEEIQEKEYQNVAVDASQMMLAVETKAINAWVNNRRKSILFIDGPIIDPPMCTDPSYIDLRCAALTACLSSNIIVIGCVKRVMDRSFIAHCGGALGQSEPAIVSLMEQFPSDTHLLTFIFAKIAKDSYPSDVIVVSASVGLTNTRTSSAYAEREVFIRFIYIQASIASSLLRLEIPFSKAEISDERIVSERISSVIAAAVRTTYPGHYVPLPVHIAHDKCNIRQGCAEVLYEEIMTRAHTSDPIEQIVLSKLR